MASEVSIKIRILAAVERLEQIARSNGIQDEFPRNARGGENMLRAVQLETVVSWIDRLLGSQNSNPPEPAPESVDEETQDAPPVADEPAPVVVKASKKK